jgi:hypothetical protein
MLPSRAMPNRTHFIHAPELWSATERTGSTTGITLGGKDGATRLTPLPRPAVVAPRSGEALELSFGLTPSAPPWNRPMLKPTLRQTAATSKTVHRPTPPELVCAPRTPRTPRTPRDVGGGGGGMWDETMEGSRVTVRLRFATRMGWFCCFRRMGILASDGRQLAGYVY